MKVTISFKNVKHSTEVDERLYEKSYKLQKFLGGKTTIKWTCSYKQGQFMTEVHLIGPRFSYHASALEENMYKSFDTAYEKIEKQLSKKKAKFKSRRNQLEELEIMDPEQAWVDYDEDYYGDVA